MGWCKLREGGPLVERLRMLLGKLLGMWLRWLRGGGRKLLLIMALLWLLVLWKWRFG